MTATFCSVRCYSLVNTENIHLNKEYSLAVDEQLPAVSILTTIHGLLKTYSFQASKSASALNGFKRADNTDNSR